MSLDFYLVGERPVQVVDLFETNITHNLTGMATALGIYECLWHPGKHGYATAKDIIPKLEVALAEMKKFPGTYQHYNAENGWGTYEQFLPWLEGVLCACITFPDAEIRTCT